MKKITLDIFKFSMLLIFILTACKKDDELKLNEPSHRVIFTSEMDFENTIEVNGEMSFGDVSSGVESRTWTFPDGIVDIIDSDNDKTSTEGNIKTIWNQIGAFDVHLTQTFKEDAFVGTTQQGRILDTTIVVTVLDSIQVNIEAQYINPDGTLGDFLDISNNAENEIPAARSVQFTWTGKGEPQFITWDFERADPSTITTSDSTINVKYKFLGTFDLMVIGSRSRPFGRDTLFLENFIKVVPSTDPVVAERITEKDGKIAVGFSRELEANSLDPNDFSISVYNRGNLITNTFTSASINPDEGDVVLIDLGEEFIYNDDSISVSFVGGNLISLDGVLATSFMGELLEFEKVNIFQTNTDLDYSFETTTSDNWVYAQWGDIWGNYMIDVTSDQSYEGTQSLYCEVEGGGGMIFSPHDINNNQVTFPANATKTYELGVWIYAVDLGDPIDGAQISNVRFFWQPNFPNSVDNPGFPDGFPTNEWVYSSNYVTFEETTDHTFLIRGFNGTNTQPLKFYMDNLALYEVELRP